MFSKTNVDQLACFPCLANAVRNINFLLTYIVMLCFNQIIWIKANMLATYFPLN